ncbi:DUF2243 domain-containing protein [Coralloluteibacterium thermophilus]|uniref:DUF2243 domain-containing protein n=1 Tax=Coralloluteibacterium thermophilum TaxID=2707049 RepID=A0ABV9NMI7_9GAMM
MAASDTLDIAAHARRRSLRAALVIGIAIMAAVDEIVFHQILAWHHFYDRATPLVGLMSDGFLHAAELIALVAGFFLYADVRRRGLLVPRAAWAGFFLGAGGFQMFDGIVDHKILRLHQVRYGVENLLVYDIAWNASGLLLFLVGVWLWRGARHARPVD